MSKEQFIGESTERMAWTQTIQQGMGNGLDAYRHKQPTEKHPILIDYYVKSRGHK